MGGGGRGVFETFLLVNAIELSIIFNFKTNFSTVYFFVCGTLCRGVTILDTSHLEQLLEQLLRNRGRDDFSSMGGRDQTHPDRNSGHDFIGFNVNTDTSSKLSLSTYGHNLIGSMSTQASFWFCEN